MPKLKNTIDEYVSDVRTTMEGPCGPLTAKQIAAKLHLPAMPVDRACRSLLDQGILKDATGPRERVARYIHRDWTLEASRAYVVKTHGEEYAREHWPHLWKEGI